jgi:stage II sporulation protein D
MSCLIRVSASAVPLAVALATIAGCGPARPVRLPAGDVPATLRVQVRESGALRVREVPLEDYVFTTVLSEVDPSIRDRALLERMFEVQAIVSRTFAVAERGRHARDGFELCSATHCQLYEPARVRASRWTDVARAAVSRTRGALLWFGSAPAHAAFHADCGGYTSAAEHVWGGSTPAYLAGARDSGPARDAHADWIFDTRVATLRDALNRDARTAVGAALQRVDVSTRDPAGRAERITLRGTRTLAVRGEVFREVVTRALGARTLRSTLFTLRRSGDRLVFNGRGFGHGVGLCQAGALARLKAGSSPERVLAFYFPGARVQRPK